MERHADFGMPLELIEAATCQNLGTLHPTKKIVLPELVLQRDHARLWLCRIIVELQLGSLPHDKTGLHPC
jgi:hypothetical protein